MRRPSALLAVLALAACGPQTTPGGPTLPPPEPVPLAEGPGEPAEAVPAPEPAPPAAPDREPWRAVQPQPAPVRPFVPPRITQVALANGIPVYVVENHALPLVVVRVLVRAGTAANPADRPGLAALTANLLDEGAGKRTALAIADQQAALGTTIATGAGLDAAWAVADTLAEKLGPSLDLLADVVLRPTFDARELERVRGDVLTDLKRQRDSGPTIAANVLRLTVYGAGHPYAYPDAGTEASVAALGPADVTGFYRAYWHPRNAAIIVAGDVTPAAARKALDARFGAWKAGAEARAAPAVPPAPALPAARKVLLVDRPDAKQGDVAIGHAGPARGAPDWYAVEVASRALGGMFSSRINMNLREDKGYTYGARAYFNPAVGPGAFTGGGGMVLDKGATALAVAELVKEVDGMRTRPPDAAELGRAKDAATLGLGARFESNASIAQAVDEIVVYGLPLDYFDGYVKAVQAVTPEDAAAAARKHLHPEALAVVVVGPAAQLEKDLAPLQVGPRERRDPTGAPVK